MPRRHRILVSLGIGIVCALLSYVMLVQRGYLASDFEWPLRAARAVLAGQNPYEVVRPIGPYPLDHFFFYPLPAGLVAVPFAWLDDYLAGAAFFGASSALLAYAILREGQPWRLILFLSAPAFVAAYTAQMSPLIMVAAFLPSMQWLAVCKPNLGIPCFLYRPTRRGLIGILLVGLIAIALVPDWPAWWFVIATRIVPSHYAPILSGVGILLALSLIRIRTPEGRTLFSMALVPQALFFYDQLPLWLVPRTLRQMIFLTLSSWVGYALWWLQLGGRPDTGQYVPTAHWYVMIFCYGSALVVLLWPVARPCLSRVWMRLARPSPSNQQSLGDCLKRPN